MVIAIMMVSTGFVRPSMVPTNPSIPTSVGAAQPSQGAGRDPSGVTQEPQGAATNKRKLPASLSQSQNVPAKPKPKQSRFW